MKTKIVILNQYWYYQIECDNVDIDSVSSAISKITDESQTSLLELDDGTKVIMPKNMVAETSFFIEESE